MLPPVISFSTSKLNVFGIILSYKNIYSITQINDSEVDLIDVSSKTIAPELIPLFVSPDPRYPDPPISCYLQVLKYLKLLDLNPILVKH